MAVTLWNMWKARNQAIFRGRKPEASAIIDSALAILKSYNRWNPRKGGSSDSMDERSDNSHRVDEWRDNRPTRLSDEWSLSRREPQQIGEDGSRANRREEQSWHKTPELRNTGEDEWAASGSGIRMPYGELRNRSRKEGTTEESCVGESHGVSLRPRGFFADSGNRASAGMMKSVIPEAAGQRIPEIRRFAETHEADGQPTHAINGSENQEAEREDQSSNEPSRSVTTGAVEGRSGTRRPHGELQTRTRAEAKGEEDTPGRSARKLNGEPPLRKDDERRQRNRAPDEENSADLQNRARRGLMRTPFRHNPEKRAAEEWGTHVHSRSANLVR